MLRRRLAWLAPLALSLAACDSNNPTTRALSISTTVSPSTLERPISFSAAQVVINKIALAPVGTTCAAETEREDAIRMSADERDDDAEREDGPDEGCEALKIGPLTVDLPLDASTELVLDALVPAGTYSGVRARLDAVTVSGVYTDLGGADHPFTFTSRGKAVVKIKFSTPVTVGPATSNVTVTIDVASWFKNASGAFLDPSDDTNTRAINRNIRRSFRAFGDHDHDGVDDQHEDDHGRGDGRGH